MNLKKLINKSTNSLRSAAQKLSCVLGLVASANVASAQLSHIQAEIVTAGYNFEGKNIIATPGMGDTNIINTTSVRYDCYWDKSFTRPANDLTPNDPNVATFDLPYVNDGTGLSGAAAFQFLQGGTSLYGISTYGQTRVTVLNDFQTAFGPRDEVFFELIYPPYPFQGTGYGMRLFLPADTLASKYSSIDNLQLGNNYGYLFYDLSYTPPGSSSIGVSASFQNGSFAPIVPESSGTTASILTTSILLGRRRRVSRSFNNNPLNKSPSIPSNNIETSL
jgi:hypothetical protein